MIKENRPEYGKMYSLTGGTGKKAISNGNTWAESEVKKIVNSNGYCRYCLKKQIYYSIENNNFTYFCVKCEKYLDKTDVLTTIEAIEINVKNNYK